MDVNEKTLKIFKGFINDLIKVFPEHKDSLETNYNDVLNLDELIIDDNELIKEFLNNIDELSDDISNKNAEIFTDELFIVKDISMKSIWDSGISDRTKNSIWNYLQSFCLINITINSNDKINEVLKSIESNEKVKDKKTLKDMKKIKKINDNLNNDSNDGGEKSGMGEINNVLENTTIGNLAKEITEDLNLDNMDQADMGNFFKPDNMMNIFQKINSTLSEKIDNNEIDGNDLLGEASNLMNGNDMMSNMMGMFQNMQPPGSSTDGQAMPDLSNMMNMFQNMQQAQQPQQARKTNQNSNHNPNVVKERLRKKLDAKK